MTSWRLPEDAARVLAVLSRGEIEVKGRIRWSSNAIFLVAVHPSGSKVTKGGGSRPSQRKPSQEKPSQGKSCQLGRVRTRPPGVGRSWRYTSRPRGNVRSGTSLEDFGSVKLRLMSCHRA